MKTFILILLDESQSMATQKDEVIEGFNSFIADQKKIKKDKASVTFIKFNIDVIPVLKCVPIKKVPELIQYHPNQGTALYDAIWTGVQEAEETEHLFDRVICVIMTDGEDNRSKKITKLGVADLIKKKERGGKWTFLYIGQNPENWAKAIGMSSQNTITFNHRSPNDSFQKTSRGVTMFRNDTIRQSLTVFSESPSSSSSETRNTWIQNIFPMRNPQTARTISTPSYPPPTYSDVEKAAVEAILGSAPSERSPISKKTDGRGTLLRRIFGSKKK